MAHPLPQAVLLVDGYNIIGAWAYLKKTRDRDGLEEARWQLIQALINYSAFQGFSTEVVFDAQYQNTCSNHKVITPNLSAHYTDFGQTADTYIEKSCACFRPYLAQSQPLRLIVATSDRTQQLMVLGYGAECMSAQQLGHEVESAAMRVRHQNKPRKHSSSRFLANSLDPKARQWLTKLRTELK